MSASVFDPGDPLSSPNLRHFGHESPLAVFGVHNFWRLGLDESENATLFRP